MAGMVGQRPTRRQLEVLRAYIARGSIASAAHDREIAESTARQHLSGLYRRAGRVSERGAGGVLAGLWRVGLSPVAPERAWTHLTREFSLAQALQGTAAPEWTPPEARVRWTGTDWVWGEQATRSASTR